MQPVTIAIVMDPEGFKVGRYPPQSREYKYSLDPSVIAGLIIGEQAFSRPGYSSIYSGDMLHVLDLNWMERNTPATYLFTTHDYTPYNPQQWPSFAGYLASIISEGEYPDKEAEISKPMLTPGEQAAGMPPHNMLNTCILFIGKTKSKDRVAYSFRDARTLQGVETFKRWFPPQRSSDDVSLDVICNGIPMQIT